MERTTLNIPVIALRGLTVFPDLTLSFDVEREISIYALDNAMEGDRSIFLVTQREIARQIGISRSYVSRIEKRALERLSQGFSEKRDCEKK